MKKEKDQTLFYVFLGVIGLHLIFIYWSIILYAPLVFEKKIERLVVNTISLQPAFMSENFLEMSKNEIAELEVKSHLDPELKTELRNETKPELKQEFEREVTQELKLNSPTKPEPKPEPKAEPKPEPKAEPKIEPKPEPKPEPKIEPKPAPKKDKPKPVVNPAKESDLKSKSPLKPAPKSPPKPSPKPDPKPAKKPDPKPKSPSKPTPKSEPKKPAPPSPSSPPSPPSPPRPPPGPSAADIKKQQLLAEAKKSLLKLGQGQIQGQGQGKGQGKQGGQLIDVGEIAEPDYQDLLIGHLKQKLRLPEFGEVKIRLVVSREGSVISVATVSAVSDSNKSYIEKTLPKLKLPPFGKNFGKESSHTFTLTLTNDR